MSKTYKFVVNTENVNSYGYRVLTDGIDYSQYMRNPVVLFMHERYNDKNRGGKVIGRTVKLYKENSQLVAEIEFDENDAFAQKIAQKVEGGFIRMASLYADDLVTSVAPEDLLPGQKYETVKECKLIEISIVDIGGNDDALRLSKNKDGQIPLKLVNQKSENTMSELKTIALALGKAADTGEAQLLQTITEMKLSQTKAETESKEWEGKYKALQKSEAETITDKAVVLGLVTEDLKDGILLAFEANHEGQKAKLSKLISDKEDANGKNKKQTTIAGAVQLSKQNASVTTDAGEGQETFDYLQKHNVVELQRIRTEEPTKYVQLAKDYASGIRHKG